MIPKVIHYCWFGRGEMPPLALDCIASWHKHMPEYGYVLWNEDNFDVNSVPYTKEAYESGKYAFVSDYVRLHALATQGGIYMDVDFEVYRPFDDLLVNDAFAGFEGSKHSPLMMGVIASKPGGAWVSEQLSRYSGRHFLTDDGKPDLTTNVEFVTAGMLAKGFKPDGKMQSYEDLTVYPVDRFCPMQTTGEYFRTGNTYCEHKGLHSWSGKGGWKMTLRKIIGRKAMTRLIKFKRYIAG